MEDNLYVRGNDAERIGRLEAEIRILSIGNFGYGWDGSICDEEHIAGALEELGHEVIRHQREEKEIMHNSDWSPDFILISQWDGYGDPGYISGWYNAPLVYWAFDYQANGQEWHERLVAKADLYLSKRIADSKYPNWQWLSQDFAPMFLKPAIKQAPCDIEVLFTGSYLPWATERNETLKAIDEKFNLVIHSINEWPGFKDQRGPIMDEGLPELYNRAKVILSIDHTLENGYWSDRNAQIIACARSPLFRYIPLSETRFKDIVTYFYSIDDCLSKISELLESPYKKDSLAYLCSHDFKVDKKVKEFLTIVESIL